MQNFVEHAKIVLSVFLASVITALGGFDTILHLLLILLFADMVTGVLYSIKSSRYRLKISIWGIWVKICELLTVAICNYIDQALGTEPWLRNIAIIWYAICESASVLGHMASLGVPMPKGLIGVLKQAKQGFGISITKVVKRVLKEYAEKVMPAAENKGKAKELEERK